MELKLPKEVLEILKKFKDAKYQIYIVGGAVRDLILGREVKDWDFTTDAKPEEILKLFPEGFYDNNFGTVGIPVKSQASRVKSEEKAGDSEENFQRVAAAIRQLAESEDTRRETELAGSAETKIFEVTTMRKEGSYIDHRHPNEISWTNKIEEDLARRDFTINAMALSVIASPQSGEAIFQKDRHVASAPRDDEWVVIDPYNGQRDLQEKLIRAVGDPEKRFQEDALRLIRAARFASQLGFDIDEKTFSALKSNSALIKNIAWERIRDELFKILDSMNPYMGLLLFKESGILEIILPEVDKCFGIVQEGPKHDRVYDIGDHSFRAVRECPSNNPLVRFAALLHDVGKVDTHKIEEDGNVTFYNHDVVGGEIVLNIAERFHLSNEQKDKLYKLVRWHLFSVNENQTDAAIRRFIKNVGKDNIEDMISLRIADRLGGDTRNPVSWRMDKFLSRIQEVLKKPFSVADLKVNGKDVMAVLNINPSRKVGEVLKKLFQEVLDDQSKNNKDFLISRMRELN